MSPQAASAANDTRSAVLHVCTRGSRDGTVAAVKALLAAGKLTPTVVHGVIEQLSAKSQGSLSNRDRVELGWRLLLHAIQTYGLDPSGDGSSAAAAAHGAGKAHHHNGAKDALKPGARSTGKLQVSERTLGAMAKLAGHCGDADSVTACLHTVLARRMWPSIFFFNDVIAALCFAGEHERAMSLFEGLHEFGCVPHVDTYTSLGSVVSSGAVSATRYMSAVRRYCGERLHPQVQYLCTVAVMGGGDESALTEFEVLLRQMSDSVYDGDYDNIFRTGLFLISSVRFESVDACRVARVGKRELGRREGVVCAGTCAACLKGTK